MRSMTRFSSLLLDGTENGETRKSHYYCILPTCVELVSCPIICPVVLVRILKRAPNSCMLNLWCTFRKRTKKHRKNKYAGHNITLWESAANTLQTHGYTALLLQYWATPTTSVWKWPKKLACDKLAGNNANIYDQYSVSWPLGVLKRQK